MAASDFAVAAHIDAIVGRLEDGDRDVRSQMVELFDRLLEVEAVDLQTGRTDGPTGSAGRKRGWMAVGGVRR